MSSPRKSTSKAPESPTKRQKTFENVEDRLAALGYILPPVAPPKGNYKLVVRSGNQLFLAGHLPIPIGGSLIVGKVGADLTADEAYEAAHHIALSLIATLKHELGDLNRIKQIVKLTGFVNCVDGFAAQPTVVNGCSDTLAKVFGDKGVGARSAVGTNSLPLNAPVEIEAIVEIYE
jgi:enamine deaminase RidA (YjgF/YER057c/UK114 family)